MPDTIGFLPHDADAAAPEGARPEHTGLRIQRLRDGGILAARLDPQAPQLYLSVLEDGVLWGTDLGALAGELRARGGELAPHHGTILAYLRGDDVASAPTTFYEGILRLRIGDEVRVAPGGELTRRRPAPARPASGTPLATALRAAIGTETGAAVVLGEDIASAALLAGAEEPALALTVRAGSTRAQDSSAEMGGASRARAAIEASGAPCRSVHPTTDRFKKDLADLVRTQAEPFPGLGVYAHFCALREAAAGGAESVLDASGPVGAGLISCSSPRTAPEPARGLVAGVRQRLRTRGRSVLHADAVLRPEFLTATPATGHLPAEPGTGRDTAAVVAAGRNAERFGLRIRMPLLDEAVTSALSVAADTAPEGRSAREADGMRPWLAPLAALAAPRAAATRPERLAAIDQGEWLSRLKGTLHQIFRSAEFAARPWVDQRAVLEAFEAHVAGRTTGGDDLFWRLLNLELWMRECVDAQPGGAEAALSTGGAGSADEDQHGEHDEPEPKAPLAANPGKRLDIELSDGEGGRIARRYPLQTGKFAADSDMDAEVTAYVARFFEALDAALAADDEDAREHREATVGRPWNLTISEKIIAIMQGRSYFVWDVDPSRAARTLSRYVSRTPAGIGLGDPVTMQLAIQEAGLPRVVVAAAAGAVGKLIGRRGLFYEVVGGNVRAIDGPTEYSVYPANVSAKLPPKDPDRVAEHLNEVVRAAVPEQWRDTFTGTVVMDANDIGRNTLGQAAPRSGTHYELQFADNPLGQGREQTPMAIVFER